MYKLLRKLSLSAIILCSFIQSVEASQFSTIYAFGDSLSDAGNIYAATGGLIPAAPYVNGHFTNGQVWVQDLSATLGLGNLTASLTGGNDYAYGDAFTGLSPVRAAGAVANQIDLTGSLGQIYQFSQAHPTADPNALYTIWVGSNDVSAILQSGATPTQAALDAGASIANIDSAINSLAGLGAKNFLILTVPDLGLTPAANGFSSQASALSAQFDLALVNGVSGQIPSLGQLAGADGIHISVLNTFSLIDGVVANYSAYGFTDVTDPCFNGTSVCSTTVAGQNQYLFWDTQHPTAGADALVAGAAATVLSPEPGTISLLGAGLAGLIFLRRKLA